MKADSAAPSVFPRRALVDAVLCRREPIVLIEAGAGMGKSVLFAMISVQCGVEVHCGVAPADDDEALALWDIAPGVQTLALPERFLSGRTRLIVAKRPEDALPGLDRACAYGRVWRIPPADLLFRPEDIAPALGAERAAELIERTAGWPALVAACLAKRTDPAEAAAYCLAAIYAACDEESLVAAECALSSPALTAAARNPAPIPNGFREAATSILDRESERRSREAPRARRLADAYLACGLAPRAIRALQAAGLHHEALTVFADAGGWAFTFPHGPDAFDAALAGFPEPLRRQAEPLVLASAFQALKQGDVARAKRVMYDRFGPASRDPARVFASASAYSTAMRCFYFAMMPYEGLQPDADLLERAFATLAEVPTDAHLARGSFYNAALEFYIRENRFAEAEDLAKRALHHYERAGVAILGFYICVHLTIIGLNMGDGLVAAARCEDARGWLARVPYDSPGDRRIFSLLEACVDYERGQSEALMTFLSRDIDRFTLGETWPSLVELAVNYGAQALGEFYSPQAALAFIDRWRLHELSSRTLKLAIALRAVATLQNANRWDDAEEALAVASAKISRERILGGTVDLKRLREREPLLCALAWMRQIAYAAPKTPGLERRLTSLRDNLALSPRQRVGVEIWLGHVWRLNRDLGRARPLLRSVFASAARTGALGALAGERVFLTELLQQRQILDFVETSPEARQTLRKLRDVGFAPNLGAARLGLTRQETKLMRLACRGATNKDAAKALGLSEATVKFHLGNVYRKLGCRGRSEATATAHALGLMQ